ncbi:MAG: carboxypeptidase-like regulatory domain-containing protein [Bryobacteraceae bacterium]
MVNTNAQGQASVQWKLGARSGAGINRVEASAAGFSGPAMFSATGTPAAAAQINVDAGAGQTGATSTALAKPFVVVVTDSGFNRLDNKQVTFTVVKGGGNIGGATSVAALTDSDGRALVTLTLGPLEGIENNQVEVTFTGNTGAVARFTATGRIPGDASQTKITGVVVDNSNIPIPGATVRLYRPYQGEVNNVPVQVGAAVTTDSQGQFTILSAPVGKFKLFADGSTSQRPGPWPSLEYDLVTIAGHNNTIGMPIYLPQLDSVNKLCVTDTSGGTLTLPQVPGFSLTVAPGSATFPGGARNGCITVTPVHMDKVPMVPGFGQQPRFVVTIQPVGTTFNPAASMSIPNVDGLKPREVTEMYSFDHDLNAFVAIGTAAVSEDGSVIKSSLGVGVMKAGWHCSGLPVATGNCENVTVEIVSVIDDTSSLTVPAPMAKPVSLTMPRHAISTVAVRTADVSPFGPVIDIGKIATPTARGMPGSGTYTWSSSNSSVAQIQNSNGSTATVRGVSYGGATITVNYSAPSGAPSSTGITITVGKLKIVEPVTTPSQNGSFVSSGNSTIGDNIDAHIVSTGVPGIDSQVNWQITPYDENAGPTNPASAQHTPSVRFISSSLVPTLGSYDRNLPVSHTVTASVNFNGATLTGQIPVKQDQKDIMRQEYIDYHTAFQGPAVSSTRRGSICLTRGTMTTSSSRCPEPLALCSTHLQAPSMRF